MLSSVYHHIRIYPYHIFVVSGEHIKVYFKKVGQLSLHFENKVLTQLETPPGISVTNPNIFQLTYRACISVTIPPRMDPGRD